MEIAFLKTPLGIAEIKGDEMGLVSISILNDKIEYSSNVAPSLNDAIQQLQEYFAGERKEFQLKLNPQGTPFQKKVWKSLLEIPYGDTTSYLKLSHFLGNKKAIRAVAAANSKNPLWIVVPCHRVIGTDGSLTGYAGGLWRKKWLLEHENPPVQTSLF
ncbi:methylated-DNA--[protein]-cysteine S-methyltransferase [uncultured Planktosalinus sp.]|uniref:methylated-DNA--[protein]-cysteine S-methyltransferase n=1 Tax=uncultured Planktosalinus sp. TaxID=1810935 RepID=UPI0030DA03AA